MNLEERQYKIKNLTDAQAISISRLLKDTIHIDKLPADYSLNDIDPVEAVYALYKESGHEIDKDQIRERMDKANENEVGAAAKEFLVFAAKQNDKELVEELDQELETPPDERTAVIDPGSLLIIIFGGIVLLNMISNIRYRNGKFEYDPQRGKHVSKQNIDGVVNIFKAIIPWTKR